MVTALTPKHKHAAGARCTVAPARPSIDGERAAQLAAYAKALGDPVRVQLVDVLAAHPGELCACELLPLFEIAQSTLSHHLKTLADAGILETRRQGLFAYYLVRPQTLAELSGWLVRAAAPEGGVMTAASQRDGTQSRAGASELR
ncbi:MAG TPA: metalloregulator ArsR/SmtB family transcription factor [Solirubrobacteraceae bacterium]|nr:metalloregulator ArsR/SmtB family transcription factor [Solirubrobacteraceae bacterium]